MGEGELGNELLKDILDAPNDEACEAARQVASSEDDNGMEEEEEVPEDMIVIMNNFRPNDWLKVVRKVQTDPSLEVMAALREIGSDLLRRMQEAAATQYEDAAPGPVSEAIRPQAGLPKLQEMAKWTPLRLIYEEREFLRLLEGTLNISEYNDRVDILFNGNKERRIINEIRKICSILSGLVVARDYENGQKLILNKNYKLLSHFFSCCFEIGRRYKILNPERMRENYPKLMYFLMDTQKKNIKSVLEVQTVIPIKTVSQLLAKKHIPYHESFGLSPNDPLVTGDKISGLVLLTDPLLIDATEEIYHQDPQSQMHLSKRKQQITKQLIAKYGGANDPRHGGMKKQRRGLFGGWWNFWNEEEETETDSLAVPRQEEWESSLLTPDDVELAIYSLKDHNTFLRYNEKPVSEMLELLTKLFSPETVDPQFTLAIHAGYDGARLSHSHARQYQYVFQSLLLWKEILRNLLMLWHKADEDLLAYNNGYSLQETGQGLNRVQYAPRVRKALETIITRVKSQAGGWVGSSVVHLGDHNVPNAFIFINKYIQIPLFINPVLLVLKQSERLYNTDPGVKRMIDEDYGGYKKLRLTILCDFFRHAFDGSGADNFFDAGSCIDGRLTSAWNWCSLIEKKKFYPIFLLAGFNGFDGKF